MRTITFLILLLSLSFATASRAAAEDDFQVIVNPANPMTTIDQRFLAELFLKKKVYWPDMHVVIVVDLSPTSHVRQQFSDRVLERSVSAVRNYWQQLLFSGRAVPPPEMRTEQDVMNFVATHEDAIGYVSSRADLRDLKSLIVK